MDTVVIDDLKQFIATTIGQQIFVVSERLDKVETKIDDLSTFVAEALDASKEATNLWLQDHEKRITKLEQKPV